MAKLVTVNIEMDAATGGPSAGTVLRFDLAHPIVDEFGNLVVSTEPVRVALDPEGRGQVDLYATNDPSDQPVNNFYRVTKWIGGGPVYRDPSWNPIAITIPYDADEIDLSDWLVPVDRDGPSVYSWVTMAQLEAKLSDVTAGTVKVAGPALLGRSVAGEGPAVSLGTETVREMIGPFGYRHVQDTLESTWVVHHNLGFRPGGVYLLDQEGNQMIAPYEHLNENTLYIHHLTPQAGTADIS